MPKTKDVKEQREGGGFDTNPQNINKEGAPDKQWRWRELFIAELDLKSKKDVKMKKKQAIVEKLVDKAEDGDVQAFDRIADRMEGKAPQSIGIIDPDGEFKEQSITIELVKSPKKKKDANDKDTRGV